MSMMNRRGRKKRPFRSRNSRNGRGLISGPEITQNEVWNSLNDMRSFNGMQYDIIRVPSTTTTVTTTVTTGVASFSNAPNLANVTGATRFTNMWDEYRIIEVVYEVYPLVESTGVMNFWFDEKNNATGTANEALERNTFKCLNTNASNKGIQHFKWNPKDLLDLQYTSTSTTSTNDVYFKGYTDAASWGAPIAATAIWVFRPIVTFEFRGLKST